MDRLLLLQTFFATICCCNPNNLYGRIYTHPVLHQSHFFASFRINRFNAMGIMIFPFDRS